MGSAEFYYRDAHAPEPNRPNHIGAAILIFYEGKVLLESRTDSERWAFVGGGLYLHETLMECIIRETYEETGLLLRDADIQFCALFDDPSIIIKYPDGNIIRSITAVYKTVLKELPELRCSAESKELRFFSAGELRDIKLVETHIPLEEYFFPELVGNWK